MATKKRPRKAAKSRKPRKPQKPKLSKYEQLERYTRSLEKRLKKYERGRKIGPVRPGATRRKPSRTELDAIRAKLKLFMEGAKRQLETSENIASKYRSHENADGSIDAELRVLLEDSGDVKGTMIDIEDSGKWNSLSEFWLMIGLVTTGEQITGSPTLDKRPNRAWTNPVRGNRAGAAFFTAGETVVNNLEKYGAEFSTIVVRVFWSPDNERMHRPR